MRDLFRKEGEFSKTSFFLSISFLNSLIIVNLCVLIFLITRDKTIAEAMSGISALLGIPNGLAVLAYTGSKAVDKIKK